jgi:trans-aconitate 2-methyltransferase
MVAQMQKHYGQELNVGVLLTGASTGTSWCLIHSESIVLEKSARDMAQLHVMNLRTWGGNDFAVRAFDRCELDHLESALGSIASGSKEADVVYNTAKRIVARRK